MVFRRTTVCVADETDDWAVRVRDGVDFKNLVSTSVRSSVYFAVVG